MLYYHVDDYYTRYEINFNTETTTLKALCCLREPNESRDTQCFDNWRILQPKEHTITAAEYIHQCCIISTFKRSIFTSSL